MSQLNSIVYYRAVTYAKNTLVCARVCVSVCVFHLGNVWIYSTFGKFTTNPDEPTYCHYTLYWYAFWLTTAGYIILGVAIIGICCITCCTLICASACKGDTY